MYRHKLCVSPSQVVYLFTVVRATIFGASIYISIPIIRRNSTHFHTKLTVHLMLCCTDQHKQQLCVIHFWSVQSCLAQCLPKFHKNTKLPHRINENILIGLSWPRSIQKVTFLNFCYLVVIFVYVCWCFFCLLKHVKFSSSIYATMPSKWTHCV